MGKWLIISSLISVGASKKRSPRVGFGLKILTGLEYQYLCWGEQPTDLFPLLDRNASFLIKWSENKVPIFDLVGVQDGLGLGIHRILGFL